MFFSKKISPTERNNWLYERLAKHCEPKGFNLLPNKHQFRRRTELGFQTLILSTSHYDDITIFELHLGIRNEVIEKMAFQFTNGLPLFQRDSMTLVTSMGKLQGLAFQRFDIKKEADAEGAMRQVALFQETVGWGWLEKHQGAKAIHGALNKLPLEKTILMSNQIYRCFRGLVAAKLTNQFNYAELELEYRDYLKWLRAPDYQLLIFDRLRRFLKDYSAN
ncbi:MAG: hypothetical protein AAF960_29825 [Bacteroidota bacterium]